MPLLASLRRLENGTVHPELEDLKKMSQTMAVSLYRSLSLSLALSRSLSLSLALSRSLSLSRALSRSLSLPATSPLQCVHT